MQWMPHGQLLFIGMQKFRWNLSQIWVPWLQNDVATTAGCQSDIAIIVAWPDADEAENI